MQYFPDVVVGEYVVVHVGFAIQRLDEQSARSILTSFERLGILEEEFSDGLTLAARHAGTRPTSTHDVPERRWTTTTRPRAHRGCGSAKSEPTPDLHHGRARQRHR